MTQVKKQLSSLYGQEDEVTDKEHNEQKIEKDEKKRKRKKRIKNKQKHPPEYYEELKREKQNRKRQEEWNNRFNLGSIPAMHEQKQVKAKTKMKLKSLKRLDSPKTKDAIYKTFNVEMQNKQKPSKSFNIRIVQKKEEKQATVLVKKQTTEQKLKQEQKDKETEHLIQQVNKVHAQMNFPDCHWHVLIDLIKKSKEKTLKSYIHAQIAKIKSKTSSCSTLWKAIQKRQSTITTMQQKNGLNTQNIKNYRLSTLKVIEQVLKWKQECQNLYHELTKTKPRLSFAINGQNYLNKISNCFKTEQMTHSFEGNPFLLGIEEDALENDLLIKIRACQMLLLENELELGLE